jgi:hypothetical protein
MRSRETSIARILKSRRIGRLTAADVLAVLRTVTVTPGTFEAASAHIRAHRTPESGQPAAQGCAPPARQAVWPPGRADGEWTGAGKRAARRCDPRIPARKRSDRLRHAARRGMGSPPARRLSSLRTLCGAAPVARRSSKRRIITRRLACNPRFRNTLYHWPRVAVQHDSRSRAKYAVTATHVPSARSAIGCSMSLARCFATAPNLTPHWKAKKRLLTGRKSPREKRANGMLR